MNNKEFVDYIYKIFINDYEIVEDIKSINFKIIIINLKNVGDSVWYVSFSKTPLPIIDSPIPKKNTIEFLDEIKLIASELCDIQIRKNNIHNTLEILFDEDKRLQYLRDKKIKKLL